MLTQVFLTPFFLPLLLLISNNASGKKLIPEPGDWKQLPTSPHISTI